jgi:mannitol-1-phosphate 5-dehydrogenase
VALSGTRTYVGFGFGAIQAGLFLYEAFESGNFRRLVVAEVLPDVVAAVRGESGYYRLNIAHADSVAQAAIGPVEIEDPAHAADRARLVEAIAAAEEIGTAVPSVNFYVSAGEGSLHRLLAEGLRRKARAGGPRAVIYAAENHNHAAEILQDRVFEEIPPAEHEAVRTQVRFLNTVIGKMSGIIADPEELSASSLAPVTPGSVRAFLVEAFNRILISRIDFGTGASPYRRGIGVFTEKTSLLPFEEAKLYGHNATHALAAYISAILGLERIADLRQQPDVIAFLRAAFIEESGQALIRKYDGFDPLFTPKGYAAYADDLLERMINPHLRDTVERVGRDPERKLGWDDRLIGTLRLAHRYDVRPVRYALGAAAALAVMGETSYVETVDIDTVLDPLWRESSPEASERQAVVTLVQAASEQLRAWIAAGYQPTLEQLLAQWEGR